MLFFPSPMTLHDTSLRTASSMNFLKISNTATKYFYFYCYLDRGRYVPKSSWRLFVISSSYPLQDLTPFTTVPSIHLMHPLNMYEYVYVCVGVYISTNLYTMSLHHHHHYGLYHICVFCGVERKTIRAKEWTEGKLNWLKRQSLRQLAYLPVSVFSSL